MCGKSIRLAGLPNDQRRLAQDLLVVLHVRAIGLHCLESFFATLLQLSSLRFSDLKAGGHLDPKKKED